MTPSLQQKKIAVCQQKIGAKGENVGLSFYAFLANKNAPRVADGSRAVVDRDVLAGSL